MNKTDPQKCSFVRQQKEPLQHREQAEHKWEADPANKRRKGRGVRKRPRHHLVPHERRLRVRLLRRIKKRNRIKKKRKTTKKRTKQKERNGECLHARMQGRRVPEHCGYHHFESQS